MPPKYFSPGHIDSLNWEVDQIVKLEYFCLYETTDNYDWVKSNNELDARPGPWVLSPSH